MPLEMTSRLAAPGDSVVKHRLSAKELIDSAKIAGCPQLRCPAASVDWAEAVLLYYEACLSPRLPGNPESLVPGTFDRQEATAPGAL